MPQLVRTTITIPEDLYKQMKMKAVVENTSVSRLVTRLVNKGINGKNITKPKHIDPMDTLGVFELGAKKIYKSRDELYEDHINRKMGD